MAKMQVPGRGRCAVRPIYCCSPASFRRRQPMQRTLLAAALAALGTAAFAEDGYVTQTYGGGPATTPFGLCVHSGTWTPDKATAPCDAVPRAAVAPPPAPVAQRAEPAPAPEPNTLAQQ